MNDDDLAKRLRDFDPNWDTWEVVEEAASRIEALEAENARLREALEQIAVTCQEEIEARTAGMSERGLKGYRILALLQLPRDMARAALTRKGTTP
jgi:hypothetical protein